MKLRNLRLIWIVALLGSWFLRALMRTVRIRTAMLDGRPHPTDPVKERFIYAFWHDSLLVPPAMKTKAQALISRHADGELIAQVVRRLGFGVVRGSTTRGGTEGLLKMLANSHDSHLAITPDGPRGPRHRLQIGTVYLASRTGLPIIPVGVGYARAFRARSWDRMSVPGPFSQVTLVTMQPVHVPPKLDREGLERYRQLVESRMQAATKAAETWAGMKPLPKQLPTELIATFDSTSSEAA